MLPNPNSRKDELQPIFSVTHASSHAASAQRKDSAVEMEFPTPTSPAEAMGANLCSSCHAPINNGSLLLLTSSPQTAIPTATHWHCVTPIQLRAIQHTKNLTRFSELPLTSKFRVSRALIRGSSAESLASSARSDDLNPSTAPSTPHTLIFVQRSRINTAASSSTRRRVANTCAASSQAHKFFPEWLGGHAPPTSEGPQEAISGLLPAGCARDAEESSFVPHMLAIRAPLCARVLARVRDAKRAAVLAQMAASWDDAVERGGDAGDGGSDLSSLSGDDDMDLEEEEREVEKEEREMEEEEEEEEEEEGEKEKESRGQVSEREREGVDGWDRDSLSNGSDMDMVGSQSADDTDDENSSDVVTSPPRTVRSRRRVDSSSTNHHQQRRFEPQLSQTWNFKFPCSVCMRKFKKKVDLDRHTDAFHSRRRKGRKGVASQGSKKGGEEWVSRNPQQCVTCRMSFSRMDSLKRHLALNRCPGRKGKKTK
ncbi:hypothetical protein BC830DRAFT_1100656 [Chytriomyces sp. MP71]|nr:hypothetical protein BC830DRAFT_1100656 [Chytriomyces sp. MP71]